MFLYVPLLVPRIFLKLPAFTLPLLLFSILRLKTLSVFHP